MILATRLAALTLAASLGLTASAHAVTLTFAGPICDTVDGTCVDYSSILQSYGDIAGQLDVQYDSDIANPAVTPFRYWTDQYSGLFDVAFGELGAAVEIYLQPLAGYQVTLLGFDMGSYLNVDRSSQVTLLGGDGSILSSTGPAVFGAAPTHFAPGLTRADGFRIQFGPDGFDVGIDNIEFEVSAIGAGPVPEPATWAMMIAGFGAVGSIMRRRRSIRPV